MKKIGYFLFLVTLLNVELANALTKRATNKIKKTNVMCDQKYIPLMVEETLNSHSLSVKFTALRKIEQFSIKNVRGIDGVNVLKFQEQNQTDLKKGESLTSLVDLSDFSGMVYVVFDVSITVNGKTTPQSIPVALGTMTGLQKQERIKNIKEFKVKTPSGENALTVPPKKYHEMKAE
jgi:hypothetical protein